MAKKVMVVILIMKSEAMDVQGAQNHNQKNEDKTGEHKKF